MNFIFILISMSVMAIAFGTAALANQGVNDIKSEINRYGYDSKSESKLNKLAKLQIVDKVATVTSVASTLAVFAGFLA